MCPHCGLPRTGYGSVYGLVVCHTATPTLPDCYRRITVYGEPPGALVKVSPLPAGVRGIRRQEKPERGR